MKEFWCGVVCCALGVVLGSMILSVFTARHPTEGERLDSMNRSWSQYLSDRDAYLETKKPGEKE